MSWVPRYTTKMNMRTWKNTLYLDAMPGRMKPGRLQGDFASWLREMQEHRITAVVCLAPGDRIAAESPQYAAWRHNHLSSAESASAEPLPETRRIQLIDIPVEDFRAPEPFVAKRFWDAAADIATRVQDGERVFIHCGAGVGRTGMFAVAVLMQHGYSYEDAYQEIAAVGSFPERPEQREFLKRNKQ